MEDVSKETSRQETQSNVCADMSAASRPEGAPDGASCGDRPQKQRKPRYSRLKLFDKVMQKSVDQFIHFSSFNRFSSNFRVLYKKNPEMLNKIHQEFIKDLQKSIQEDIGRLMEEGQLEVKLNELDKLEEAAKSNQQPAWRPSGVPEQDLCSYLMPCYQKQEAYILRELKKIQAENAALAQKVQAGRESIAQSEQRISAAVDDLKVSVTEFKNLASSLQTADVFDV